MKKLLTITTILIALASCKKANPNGCQLKAGVNTSYQTISDSAFYVERINFNQNVTGNIDLTFKVIRSSGDTVNYIYGVATLVDENTFTFYTYVSALAGDKIIDVKASTADSSFCNVVTTAN